MKPKHIRTIRWIARIWAALMVAFMLFMFIAHIVADGIGPDFNFSARDSLMMISLILSLIGLALGWKWERLGGILALGGMGAFFLFDFVYTGSIPKMPIFLIIAFPGVLYLISAYAQPAEEI